MLKNEINEEQKEEIKCYMNECKSKKIYRKLQVLDLRANGKKLGEISEITGYNYKYSSQLINNYLKNGINYLIENKYKGNNRNLTIEEEEKFLEPFKERSEKGEMLTVSEIREEYDKLIGKKSSEPVIYLLLHRNNWRKVMPRSKNPNKADEKSIEAYKKNMRKSRK